jgi:hypothetical protein
MLSAQSFRELPLEEQFTKTQTDYSNWEMWQDEYSRVKNEDLYKSELSFHKLILAEKTCLFLLLVSFCKSFFHLLQFIAIRHINRSKHICRKSLLN